MTITVTGIDFNYHDYDERSDVLFLHVGRPKEPPVRSLETPEGHTVEYDESGAVIGLELTGVRKAVEDGRALWLTWPPAEVPAGSLRKALARALTSTLQS